MILKQIIKYKDTNSVEATWVDMEDNVLKCHCYSDIQIDMLRADALALGTDISEYEPMLADVVTNIVPMTLLQAKENKLQELQTAFCVATSLPIKVGTKFYNGGKESAQAIRDYIQLIQESGGTDYTIWDTSNVIATYTIAEANAIKLAVGTAVAQAEFNLRTKKNAVDMATSITEINAVVF